MKLLFGYTLDYLKRNRRSSFAIMVGILMTSTMMSALCGFIYNVQMDSIGYILRETGNWHGELFGNTKGSNLAILETFDSIESTMIKGDWKVAQIDDPRRDYLVWRDANTEYWDSMPEGNCAILEGRAPIKSGEIALSKQYFEHHPKLMLGDSIVLPLGNRTLADGKIVIPQDTKQPGEQFMQTDTVTLTVVAKLDFTTNSTVPAYTALGYLDPAAIVPDDDLTVYFRFQNIRDTYKELPKIAEAVGYQQDEYGNYLLRYNTDYLARVGVLAPEFINFETLLTNFIQGPMAFAVTGLMVVLLFVLVIHNAFALSSSARLTQLGIFASVGATPKQIKRSVVLEALLLTAIPLPLGLLLGQLAVNAFIWYSNQFGSLEEREIMEFAISWLSVLPAILLTLLTVWWSALIPARKIAKMSPIAAIRQGTAETHKKQGRTFVARFGKLFGLSGELAANALQARKKSYRTSIISLMLSFLILVGFLCSDSTSTASDILYQTSEKQWADQDILVTLYNASTPEDFTAIYQKITKLDGVESSAWYSTLRTAAWLPEQGSFSTAFEKRGGFPAIEEKLSNAQTPLLREGQRRVGITLLGLDDVTFANYCATLGIDPAPFYEEGTWHSILYHTVNDITTSTKRNPVPIPFLNIAEGNTMTLTETTVDSHEGDFTFDVRIAAITDELPPIGNTTFNIQYSAIQVMPLEQTRKLANHFAQGNISGMKGVVQVVAPEQIASVSARAEQLFESYFGSGDYKIYDENEYYANKAAGRVTTNMMFAFIVGLLAVIGLSNSWSTVRGTLNARRREFAMLRSVGLPPRGVKKMLLTEAILLGLTPILFSLPLTLVLQGISLNSNEVSFIQWLPYVPWQPICLYLLAILTVTIAAYIVGSRKLLSENIIEAIKLDSI